MSLTGQVGSRINLEHVNALDLGNAKYKPLINAIVNFASGTGAGQANSVFTDTRTLTASGTENLDLSGGLTDAFGNTLAFTRVKAILVVARSANTNDVEVTRPASNGVPLFLSAGDGVTIPPDGQFFLVAPDADGIAVTASTGDIITITNSAGGSSVTYDIVIVGTV